MINIREYTENDYSSVIGCIDSLQESKIAIDEQGFAIKPAGYGKFMADKLLTAIATTGGKVLLLVDGDVVIGCGACVVKPDMDSNRMEFRELHFGEIKRLYVGDEYRNKGYGKMLMSALERELKKLSCDHVSLNVLDTNIDAIFLYSKMGYNKRTIEMIKEL
jgi:ribosomal protein S18 acetylase RimI-like enzyme